MKNINKSFIAAALATTLLSAPFAMAEKVLRIGHDNKAGIMENPAHAFTGVFKNIVETATNGEIKVQVFPSNQLGSAKEHIQMVRDGQLQGTLAPVGPLAGYYPRIGVLDVPFAFSSNAATYEVFDGKFGQTLAKDIESELKDVKVLGFPDTGGFFSVTNSKRPLESLADFKGLRIRTMTLPTHQKIIQSLGAEAYPLAWGEVYSSLQTGVIDGQMNPIPTVSFAKFNEVQGYLTLTNHLFAPYTFMINKEFYDGLTPEQQAIVSDAVEIALSSNRGLARLIEASKDRGLDGLKAKMEVNALSGDQRQAMRNATQPGVIEYIKETHGDKGTELLNLFLSEVEKANQSVYLQ
ncbi:DctP family TRAP transporter solute-binding subunit [Enterovibrio nigricans]|uniref:Tripartite ATP-independent transporter solute receptor, DctP family n=1 Tax=Enterovibrio nigricans DSM 22720 TaxID=1121868 RepID=A0A1T4UFK3_9GAMM|nr:DctP family TRAP transporter solute-binding subunit [Enterovibrio nigricans]SKA51545.1 tripartite ATP-independent transporter solute receptor, DctP family [Enterovibrio nigricans DSM 22720]